jgi:hypothetical protein
VVHRNSLLCFLLERNSVGFNCNMLAASLDAPGKPRPHICCCHQVQGFYRENGRNLCFEGTVRVCKIGKNSRGETKLFAPKGDGTTYIAGEFDTDSHSSRLPTLLTLNFGRTPAVRL